MKLISALFKLCRFILVECFKLLIQFLDWLFTEIKTYKEEEERKQKAKEDDLNHKRQVFQEKVFGDRYSSDDFFNDPIKENCPPVPSPAKVNNLNPVPLFKKEFPPSQDETSLEFPNNNIEGDIDNGASCDTESCHVVSFKEQLNKQKGKVSPKELKGTSPQLKLDDTKVPFETRSSSVKEPQGKSLIPKSNQNEAPEKNVLPVSPKPAISPPKDRELEKELESKQKEIETANSNEFEKACSALKISSFWHITHKNSISQILKHGILCLDNLSKLDKAPHHLNLKKLPGDVKRDPIFNKSLDNYARLFINATNPALTPYKENAFDLCIIEVSPKAVLNQDYLITDGNAEAKETHFYQDVNQWEKLPWRILNADEWKKTPEDERKRCSEVLIPSIPVEYIQCIHCYNFDTVEFLSKLVTDISTSKPNISMSKSMFL